MLNRASHIAAEKTHMKELDSSSTGNNTIDHDLISERMSEKGERERRNDRVITSNTSD